MKNLKFSLQENAISFLEDALANAIAAEDSPERWKFAILSLVQSIELSFKQLLSNIHPLFIFINIDNPDKTVSLDKSIDRLKRISANFKISKEEEGALKLAKEARHKIVHYEIDENIIELKLAFARLFAFLNSFYEANFRISLRDQIDEDLWKSGIKIKAHGQELLKKAQDKIKHELNKEADEIINCPICGWNALVIRETNESECYMCGHTDTFYTCEKCNCHIAEGLQNESHGKIYCTSCLEYISSDYWHEQLVGK